MWDSLFIALTGTNKSNGFKFSKLLHQKHKEKGKITKRERLLPHLCNGRDRNDAYEKLILDNGNRVDFMPG
jgi:hypothetical protein